MVLSEETVESTLDVVSRLAVETITACDVASVSLVRIDAVSTVGTSDEVAAGLDAIQYEVGQGPCLDAIGKEATWFQIDRMSDDTKWPEFSRRAAEHGFESLMALTLRVDSETLGALNLYARDPEAFGEEDRDYGAIYAAYAAVALAKAQAWTKEGYSRQDSSDEPATQEIIGRAVGILMEGEFKSAEEALEVLELRAEQLKVRLRDSAQETIESADQRRAELQLPAGFYDRMMGRARGGRPPGTRYVPGGPMTVALILSAGLLAASALLGQRFNDARQDRRVARDALFALTTGQTEATLQGPAGAAARLVSSGDGSLLVVVGLEEPPAERTYQLWFVQDDEIGGSLVFDVDEAIALVDVAPVPFDRLVVTIEPEGGSREPTTDPVLQSR